MAQLPYVQLAGAIDSCLPGVCLYDLLCAEFPSISRHDAFLGFTTAFTLQRADVLVSELEARQLRQRVADLQVQLDQRVAA